VPLSFADYCLTKTDSLCPEEIGLKLQSFIDPARILTRMIDRIAFASDASLYRLIPRAVVQPIDTEEVRRLFRFSREYEIPLTFRAGGTSLSGQSITDGLLVDVGRYWRSANAEDEGRPWHVRHLGAGPHDARHRPHVEGRADAFVLGQPAHWPVSLGPVSLGAGSHLSRTRIRHDPRGHRRHHRVAEVRQ